MEQVKQIFKSKYQSIETTNQWKGFLKTLFKNQDSAFYSSPIQQVEDIKAHEDVESILEFGDLKLADDSRILFYEVKLKDHKHISSRVGLRNIIHRNVIPGDVDGIIATYFNPTANDWRLTFISKSLYWDDEFNEIKEETHPKRYTYVLGEGESIKTALTQFGWLFNEIVNKEITIEDIIKTFSVEKISNEFFKEYFNQFKAFTEYIVDNQSAFSFFKSKVDKNKKDNEQQEDAEKLVRHYVKKLLGRIVFLYFLQKKGWLGVPLNAKWGQGQKDFMSQLFKNHDNKNNYYNDVLEHLFFKALNVDRRGKQNDEFIITKTRVPYLNGGLFEKDKIEPDTLQIQPTLFEELFNFFDQYNFTIDENSPDDKDIGIDPEMLGLIFENLLEDNKDKGTFYTPKVVVHYMCKESLCNYIIEELKDKCTKEELKEIKTLVFENDKIDLKVVEKYATDIDKALSTVKVCDPAIGSGAFPMGMVYEIFRLKRLISSYLDVKDFIYLEEKLKIIRHSIYGVDIDKGAVDIARLRFWLSLIVDEQEPQPLPNLDYKIMQGDSLKESFEGIALDTILEDDEPKQLQQFTLGDEFAEPQATYSLSLEEKSNIKYWVDQYFSLEPLIKKQELHEKIDEAVIKHIHKNVTASAKDLKKQLNTLELKYANAGKNIALLKGGKDVKLYQTLSKSIDTIKAQEKRLLKVQETTERPYFLWNLFFDKVLNEGNKGFDIVIGNPPYGGIKIDDEIRERFGLVSKDPYGAFMSMAINKLLKPNGVLCYIVSDTWLTIKSHKPLREQILQHQLKNVIRLHQDCFKATVNSCIFTLIKNNTAITSNCHPELVEGSHNNPSVTSSDLRGTSKLYREVIAADLTNISTRKQVPEFRDKLLNLNSYIGQYTPDFAVYSYKQSLLSTNSHKPIIVGSPKLFALMNDVTCTTTTKTINKEQINVRQVPFNNQIIELVRFGDVADVKVGLQTGDNKYYLYQDPNARGNYKDINAYNQYLLNETDLNKIRSNDNIRLKVIESGIHKTKMEPNFDADCYFGGRYIAPYDKGGESDTDSGWLPNYYVSSSYFIDWSSEAATNLINATLIKKDSTKPYPRNKEFYFEKGISFSDSGEYAPTFRVNSGGVFDQKGSCIFTYAFNNHLLTFLNSKLFRYISKLYINHSISAHVDSQKILPINIKSVPRLEELLNSILKNQKQNPRYNYFANEQKEIDKLVYELYGLNAEDINEVETWFARRYPKLATYAYYQSPEELVQEQLQQANANDKVVQLIANGESKTVEFKSTLRYCLKQNSPQKYVEHSAIKNLAAFLNSEGGTLFIGVDDDGNILGLEDTDFASFKNDNKIDGFNLKFDQLVQNYFGNDMSYKFKVEFLKIENKTIAIIHIKDRASKPVVITNPEKNNKEEFYIRRNASAVALTMYEILNYTKENW
jgi:hypothetical protein